MILKASLHIHTNEDKKDGHMIKYNVYELIDKARECGFRILGFTPHQKFVFRKEYAQYALDKGILLIPGVERNLGRVAGNHVIILNCGKSVEKVKNLKQLARYKREHPEIFIISPHPTYSRTISIGAKNLRRYIDLFDAVEHSWIYSIKRNHNKKAARIAAEHKKPMISTADVHVLNKLNTDHALIDVDDFSINGVFEAIRQGRFENITMPKKYINLISYISWTILKYSYKYLEQKILLFGIKKMIRVKIKEKSYYLF